MQALFLKLLRVSGRLCVSGWCGHISRAGVPNVHGRVDLAPAFTAAVTTSQIGNVATHHQRKGLHTYFRSTFWFAAAGMAKARRKLLSWPSTPTKKAIVYIHILEPPPPPPSRDLSRFLARRSC